MISRKVLAAVGLLLGAPISAELLQAYLASIGHLAELAVFLLFLAPLYGGAALLIRDAVVRTGGGWRDRFLLALSFGLLMPGLVDLSLFTADNEGVSNWQELHQDTFVPLLGISLFPAASWVLGHVAMSIAVPLAILDAWYPGLKGEPLLNRPATIVLALLMLTVALLIHMDALESGRASPSPGQLAAVVALAVIPAAMAFTARHAPASRKISQPAPGIWTCLVLSMVFILAGDLVSPGWLGLALVLALAGVASLLLTRLSTRTDWGMGQIVGLACGALLARTSIGLLAPIAPGDSHLSKYAQSAVLLVIVMSLSWASIRRVAVAPA